MSSFFSNEVIDTRSSMMPEVLDRNALLFHAVAETQGDGIVFQCVAVDGDTERSADGILTAVALADGILGLDMCCEVEFQLVLYFLGATLAVRPC